MMISQGNQQFRLLNQNVLARSNAEDKLVIFHFLHGDSEAKHHMNQIGAKRVVAGPGQSRPQCLWMECPIGLQWQDWTAFFGG